jgi:hypothetical protein
MLLLHSIFLCPSLIRKESIVSLRFLSFSYKVPSEPSKNRVYIWRTMKELGAVYLQQGVALLPYADNLCSVLQKLHSEVTELGGKATLSELSFINEADERDILLEFEKLRNEEYEELSDECNRLMYELDCVTEKGKFKFSELEENDEEIVKLKRWHEKITKRDYFKVIGREKAVEMINKAEKRLHEYAEEVYKREKL